MKTEPSSASLADHFERTAVMGVTTATVNQGQLLHEDKELKEHVRSA